MLKSSGRTRDFALTCHPPSIPPPRQILSITAPSLRPSTDEQKTRLERLLRPRSLAIFGGTWAAAVVRQSQAFGFSGDLWPVHPSRGDLCGLPCHRSIEELPRAPDAAFVGVKPRCHDRHRAPASQRQEPAGPSASPLASKRVAAMANNASAPWSKRPLPCPFSAPTATGSSTASTAPCYGPTFREPSGSNAGWP